MVEPQNAVQLQHLLDLLQAGDDSVCDALLEHSLDRFRDLVQRMFRKESNLRQLDQTDDVLQKALVRLHRALREVKPPDVRAFYGLAARQIRWVVRDLAREMAVAKVLTYAAVPPEQEDPFAGPTDLAGWSEFHETIDGLPPEERETFDLLFYQGLTQEEAAEVLNTSVRTVRRRWQRARLMLDRALQGEWPRLP
jgi:RNA polymerase sigma-70 factor (ECF subfamily)